MSKYHGSIRKDLLYIYGVPKSNTSLERAADSILSQRGKQIVDGVQYEWRENDDKVMIPDVSIICNLRNCLILENIDFT